ncbi:universal stress protein UspA [Niabella ginsenosidivorans]|uniref:Universal stress protein n=1 Tax=Niabella ginsenosidivorans TaxID=1176587 RepID=A0A1A9I318_9BACT|nr:universal stress protein [Niabella ginsenosidivorans]ANH80964.1 universal stress protein UspA [Niabella ginsenosidivorans]
MEYKKILIAIDSSSYSMKAAKAGFALAHQLNAAVGIIYVVNRAKEIVNADLGITTGESETLLLNEAENTIGQYLRLYDGIGQVEKFTPEGLPEDEIINIAEQWGADMIVMGTHGRSGIGRILTGSLAEYIIRHATIPVLVAPPRME